MAREPVDIKTTTITGIDLELLRKAEQLIEVGPDEPRCGKIGTMFFNFKDYLVVSHDDGTRFWHVESIDGTKLPERLEGKFTSRSLIMDAIERHGDPAQQARGRRIIEDKHEKLARDVSNGVKDNTEFEQKRLKERVVKDARRRKQAIEAIRIEDAAKDKPTRME